MDAWVRVPDKDKGNDKDKMEGDHVNTKKAGFQPAEQTMTYNSEFVSLITQVSGEGSRCGKPQGAADDKDDMEWLHYEEQMQDPKSVEDDAEYEFPELEIGFNFRKSERAGVPVRGRSFLGNAESHKCELEV